MAIYDAGTASLAADGTVIGAGTTWRQPLTLIRVGATMIFNTTPATIVTIAEIISDTEIRVFNDKGFTAPAGTQYSILAHDGITVQGLAQDVAETLRYYQSRETEVAAAVDAFNQFDADAFQQNVTNVNNQSQQVSSDAQQVANDKVQVSSDKDSAAASAASALADKNAAANSAAAAADSAASLNTSNLLRVDMSLSDLTDKDLSRANLDVYSKYEIDSNQYPNIKGSVQTPGDGFIFQPFKRYYGDHDIRYINGGQPKSTKRFKKSGHSTVNLVGISTGATNPEPLTVDTVGYMNPANADADGTTFPTGTVFSGLSFEGDDDGTTQSGLTILQGHDFKIQECGFYKSKVSLWMRDVWMTSIENSAFFGQIKHEGGTSAFYKNCYATVHDNTVESGAYRISNLQYSNMNSCASDGTVNTAFFFNQNNGLMVNGCGCEVPETIDSGIGAAIHLDTSNEMIFNNFYTLPKAGTNILVSLNNANQVTFNNMLVYGSPSNWSRDFWILGTGNTLIINGGVFGESGRKPLIATNAAGNTVIYNSADGNEYRAKTTGAAITVNLEPKYESRDLSSSSQLVFTNTGADNAATRNFRMRKNGNIVTIDFTFSLNGYTGQAGAILINGLPYLSRYFSSGTIGYVAGLNANVGPLSCYIDNSGSEIIFQKTSSTTGNSTPLTSSDITASARVSGTITYQISSTNFD